MNERIDIIYREIDECEVFADIGCDHGLITKAMLDGKKCKRAIVSDVSKKCLEKAELLLSDKIESGEVVSVVSDGFDNLPPCDLALIAGMGGEEIVLILKKAKNLPEKLLLQPMKNPQKVRLTAVELGYKIIKDFTFKVGKIYYDLIALEKGEDSLLPDEIEYGRTNIKGDNQAFKSLVKKRLKMLSNLLENSALAQETRNQIEEEIKRLKNYA